MTIDKIIAKIRSWPDKANVSIHIRMDTPSYIASADSIISVAEFKALADEVEQLREFVRSIQAVTLPDCHGGFDPAGIFVLYDNDSNNVSVGNDAYEAWQKLRELSGQVRKITNDTIRS